MNIYALAIGIIIVFYVIIRFRKTRLEKTKWAYPLLLASFPVYYFVFAMYGNDLVALGKELLAGSIFFLLAFIAYKSQHKLSVLIVAAGSILHAVYGAYHDIFFINSGTPGWWLEFCGSIDLILGMYLIYLGLTMTNKGNIKDAQTVRAS